MWIGFAHDHPVRQRPGPNRTAAFSRRRFDFPYIDCSTSAVGKTTTLNSPPGAPSPFQAELRPPRPAVRISLRLKGQILLQLRPPAIDLLRRTTLPHGVLSSDRRARGSKRFAQRNQILRSTRSTSRYARCFASHGRRTIETCVFAWKRPPPPFGRGRGCDRILGRHRADEPGG